MDKGQMDIMLL